VLAACIAPALGPILDVYSSDGDVEVVHRAGTALAAMLATTVVATLAGAVFVWIDRRVTVPARVQRACWAAVAVAAVVGGVALLRLTSPADEAHRAWSSFRRDGPPQSEGSHFGGFGSNRYDMWRVGLREFRGHPLAGIGADNFAIQYLQERRSDEETLYPHSLAVRVASQTGIVGVLLYAAFLAFALAAALAVRGEAARDVARLAVVGFSVWFLHGQVDWLWEMPVLGAAAAALLGLAAGLARRPAARANDSSRVGTARAVAAGGVAVALGASLALPWLSARDADRALDTWRSDPDRADALLARARALNPLSERPDMLRGVILSRRGHYEAMRESFARAVARTPSNWYANFELGVASALTGRRGEALSALERARRLNPRDELVAQIAGDVRRGRRIDPAEIDRRLLERLDN
jgi:tetratricopeptide (TPR) repeat protein